jgi:hypothetical protein
LISVIDLSVLLQNRLAESERQRAETATLASELQRQCSELQQSLRQRELEMSESLQKAQSELYVLQKSVYCFYDSVDNYISLIFAARPEPLRPRNAIPASWLHCKRSCSKRIMYIFLRNMILFE